MYLSIYCYYIWCLRNILCTYIFSSSPLNQISRGGITDHKVWIFFRHLMPIARIMYFRLSIPKVTH